MTKLPLVLGLGRAPNTQALIDRSVQPKGVKLHVRTHFSEGFDNIGARHRWIIDEKIDGGELSLSSFILARLRGVPLRGLPVFLSRRFRHRCFYCSAGSPLRHPSELGGKRVTVHRYNATTPVWLKGILQNHYGVNLETVEWFVAEPDISEESLHPPPPRFSIRLIPPPLTRAHAIELVEDGRLDAAFEPYQGLFANRRLRHLIPNFRQAEQEFFRRTGAFPINHVVVLREEIAEANPWVVESLLTAFRQAESSANRYRKDEDRAEAKWERTVMGEDFSYSLRKGCARRSLATLIEYQVQQGILDKRPNIESLFFPAALDL
ncbi:MAG: hypothetical protein ACE5HC_00115 [Candidatus Binatia bacterium]